MDWDTMAAWPDRMAAIQRAGIPLTVGASLPSARFGDDDSDGDGRRQREDEGPDDPLGHGATP